MISATLYSSDGHWQGESDAVLTNVYIKVNTGTNTVVLTVTGSHVILLSTELIRRYLISLVCRSVPKLDRGYITFLRTTSG